LELFKYETHAHTSEVSICSKISAVELVQFYKQEGFRGLCITDHFLNGNTSVPKDLAWDKRIELFCKGYELAYKEGKRIGIDVFFGWEYTYKGTDLLTYGLDKKWLLRNPELLELSINQYCDLVHRDDGFIVHAHPFREADYIDMIRLLPRKVDAVEVINASRTDFENDCGEKYANMYKLLRFAGTDNHRGLVDRISGIQLNRPLENLSEMINAIRNNEVEIFTDIMFR